MMNKMDWKAWLGLIVIVMIISGFVSGFAARAESEVPTDVEIVEDANVVVGGTAENNDTSAEDAVTDLPVEVPTEDTTEQPEDDTTQSDTPVETPDNTTQPDDSVEIPDDGSQTETPSDDPAGDSTTAPDTPTETPDEQPTDTPEQPEEPEQPPVDLKTLFDVSIKVPSGWRNTDSAAVRIKITPASDQLWHKVRYRTPTPQIVYVTPEPAPATQQPAPIVVEDDGMEEMLPMILLIGGVAAIGGAIFWLVKKKDSSARNVPDFDDEYEFEDDEESDE